MDVVIRTTREEFMSSATPAEVSFHEATIVLPGEVTVRTIDEGAGPIVLLLHGNPDNADEWKPLIRLLRRDHRCIAPDLPGYGRRGRTNALPPAFDYSVRSQIRFVDDLLAALRVDEKITIVLHDIGGIMGVPWAAQNTGRLRAVVFTNTVAYPRFRWFALARRWGNPSPIGRAVGSLSARALAWAGGAIFRRVFSRQNPQLSPAEIDRFVADFALNATARETTVREFREITRIEFFDGYDVMLKRISESVPTLTLWGEGDPYVEGRYAEQLFARKTVMLPGVGHWVPIVAADRLAEEIRSISAG
jgi:pimeloyl-ACP methyl ester carboxylesterase